MSRNRLVSLQPYCAYYYTTLLITTILLWGVRGRNQLPRHAMPSSASREAERAVFAQQLAAKLKAVQVARARLGARCGEQGVFDADFSVASSSGGAGRRNKREGTQAQELRRVASEEPRSLHASFSRKGSHDAGDARAAGHIGVKADSWNSARSRRDHVDDCAGSSAQTRVSSNDDHKKEDARSERRQSMGALPQRRMVLAAPQGERDSGRMLAQMRTVPRLRMSDQTVAPEAHAAHGSLQARHDQSLSLSSTVTLDAPSSIEDQPYHLRHSSWDVFVTVARTAAHAGVLLVLTCLALCTMVLYIRAHTWVQGLSDQAFR